MADTILTHEQKVETLLATSAILQAQLLNIAAMNSSVPEELKADILELVGDAQSSIKKVLTA
jgi:hypothetical protein